MNLIFYLTVLMIAIVLYAVARIVGALTNWVLDEIEQWWDRLGNGDERR